MMIASPTLSQIWRHPIKAHGAEALTRTELTAGKTLPWDRVWAVAHEASKADGAEWVPCANFSRVSKAPALMAISATLDEASETLTLSHPNRPDLQFSPDRDVAAFLDWVRPLMPEDRAASARIIRVPGRGMTDSDFPSVTLCNLASHREVEQRLGHPLSIDRWRGNIWLDGFAEWEEFDWIGKDIRIGSAILRPIERTDRCPSTRSNPVTGLQDVDVVSALDSFGHRDFSVRAEVLQGGTIEIGSKAELV